MKPTSPGDCLVADGCAGGHREQCGAVAKQWGFAKAKPRPVSRTKNKTVNRLSYFFIPAADLV
ncbi:MAG: hypothetical protein IKJ74_06395 [Clostridia bacterium]|nr:hypothetical protein [Clostridia bacterium]